MIGVGGRPSKRWGCMACCSEVRLLERPGAFHAEAVAERGVDGQRHSLLESVVDHRGNEGALAGRDGLLLDQRGDDQDVVRRPPRAFAARRSTDAHRCWTSRSAWRQGSSHSTTARRSTSTGKKALDAAPLQKRPERDRSLRRSRRCGIARPLSRGVTPRFRIAICRTSAARSAIWPADQPSGKLIFSTGSVAAGAVVAASRRPRLPGGA